MCTVTFSPGPVPVFHTRNRRRAEQASFAAEEDFFNLDAGLRRHVSFPAFAYQHVKNRHGVMHMVRSVRPQCLQHSRPTPLELTAVTFKGIEYLKLLRVTLVNRTYGGHKNLHIHLFLLTIFGPIYYRPP